MWGFGVFKEEGAKALPLLARLRLPDQHEGRKNWGYRFLKPHQIKWMTSRTVLHQQTGLSLKDRSALFGREFPTAHMNPTLLRRVYSKHKIRKKKYRWNKQPKNQDAEEAKKWLTNMKRQLTKCRNQGYRIVYLDETFFTRNKVPELEWALPK